MGERCSKCGGKMKAIPGAEKQITPIPGFKAVAVVECKKCSVARVVFEGVK